MNINISQILDSICQPLGLPSPVIYFRPCPDFHCAVLYDAGQVSIVMDPLLPYMLGLLPIYGVLAHEMGHVVCGHLFSKQALPSHQKEYEADEFAASIGLGQALRAALEGINTYSLARNHCVIGSSDTHPAIADRLARL